MYRYEVKYFISKRQAAELRLFLKSTMNQDSNGNNTGSYWVRSQYFDTMGNRDYYEKITGHSIRKKIRLRIYNISTDTVKLEIKNKFGSMTLKESAIITKEDARKLICGDYSPLRSYNEPAANKAYAFFNSSHYRPTVIIDYEREAYLYPFHNIRVTLDKDLHAGFCLYDLFEENINMIPVFSSEIYILEVKYYYILPVFLQKALSYYAMEKSGISKYCLGRSVLESRGAV